MDWRLNQSSRTIEFTDHLCRRKTLWKSQAIVLGVLLVPGTNGGPERVLSQRWEEALCAFPHASPSMLLTGCSLIVLLTINKREKNSLTAATEESQESPNCSQVRQECEYLWVVFELIWHPTKALSFMWITFRCLIQN